MKLALVFLFQLLFVVTTAVGDDGCCERLERANSELTETSVQSASSERADETPLACDCTSCLSCVRCGSIPSEPFSPIVFALNVHSGREFYEYVSLSPSTPFLPGLKRPPIA